MMGTTGGGARDAGTSRRVGPGRPGVRVGSALVLAMTLLGLGQPSLAQSVPAQPPVWSAGFDVGVFADLPDLFAADFCEQQVGAVSARAVRWIGGVLGVEGALTSTFEVGGTQCFLVGRPPPLPDDPYWRRSLEPGQEGVAFRAATLGLVAEPWADFPVSPRARAGVARILSKDLGAWFAGGGFRFSFGRHAMVMDVERWRVYYDVREERVVLRTSGVEEILMSDLVAESADPFVVRVGWEVSFRKP